MEQHPSIAAGAALGYGSVNEARDALIAFEARYRLPWPNGLELGLHSATSAGDVEAMTRLGVPIDGLRQIEYGDLRAHYETALLTALVDKHYDAARALLAAGAAVDATCAVWMLPGDEVLHHTALHMVVARADVFGVRILLDAGADVDRQTTLGETPVFYAASDDNLALVQLLLAHGCDPTIPSYEGKLPQDVAGRRTRHLLG